MSFEPLIPDGDLRVQQRIIELLGQLAPNDGYTDAALEGVRFMRVNTSTPRCPVLYEPSIVIVCHRAARSVMSAIAPSSTTSASTW